MAVSYATIMAERGDTDSTVYTCDLTSKQNVFKSHVAQHQCVSQGKHFMSFPRTRNNT